MQRRGSRVSDLNRHSPSQVSCCPLSKDLEAVSDLEIAVRVFFKPFSKVNIPKQNWSGEETMPLDLEKKGSVWFHYLIRLKNAHRLS